ncbi:hydroxylamine reductase [Natranaerofaba carboxydovora]|uniref:hydroxylamine reductase n=1 Tax=Natranaerofaba carboxydovora TaxID=2742683 RepID=UPI001F128D74|nr:hydroxylamine reductase [Natranaerofaba carboxydovora]UMZ72894.1 Hydroxylamine reductase [Natranaerofaba carboxydovora]
MSEMFCYQCQEAAKNEGCSKKGVCGKTSDVANLQDLLLHTLKGLSYVTTNLREKGESDKEVDNFIMEGLFATLTNTNFDRESFINKINEAIKLRDKLKGKLDSDAINSLDGDLKDAVNWSPGSEAEFDEKGKEVGVLATENEDVRSLRELLTYGLKGIAAYGYHAENLGYSDDNIHKFMQEALAKTLDDSLSGDDLTNLVLECGKYGVDVMSLLDKANTETYGNPEISKVKTGVGDKPGILVSGHDLKDLEELLEQTKGQGVDVYTHGEMLPAHYYPAFKKYDHFVGNYGSAWPNQDKEFEAFGGPILMTTNCLIPPKDSYKDRVYTTGVTGFEGLTHIPESSDGKQKDYSQIIEHAKKCSAPKELENGEIVGGFAHNAVLSLADKVVDAVKQGHIKKFVVMAGCDGRHNSRDYYTDFAKSLPEDTVILTAGCAKYRYNKLDLGDIGGIPRVLDAGQCNDSYSLAVIALKLKEVFDLEDINQLPIVYNIAWYEQKACLVLLALLHLGVKNIHLGPTLPAFLSPNVANVLVENFGIGGVSTVEEDIEKMIK